MSVSFSVKLRCSTISSLTLISKLSWKILSITTCLKGWEVLYCSDRWEMWLPLNKLVAKREPFEYPSRLTSWVVSFEKEPERRWRFAGGGLVGSRGDRGRILSDISFVYTTAKLCTGRGLALRRPERVEADEGAAFSDHYSRISILFQCFTSSHYISPGLDWVLDRDPVFRLSVTMPTHHTHPISTSASNGNRTNLPRFIDFRNRQPDRQDLESS